MIRIRILVQALLRTMPIPNALVSLIEESIPRNVVRLDVRVDLCECPGEEGVQF